VSKNEKEKDDYVDREFTFARIKEEVYFRALLIFTDIKLSCMECLYNMGGCWCLHQL